MHTLLIALTKDSTVKPADRQKLKGYILKWQNSNIILACAFFHDLLDPIARLSELCLVNAIEVVMKTKKALDKGKSSPFEDLPTVKNVLAQYKEEDGLVTYQGQEMKKYKDFLKTHYSQWVEAAESCLQNRVKTGEVEIISHAITILATHGWERTSTPSFAYTALEAAIYYTIGACWCRHLSSPWRMG